MVKANCWEIMGCGREVGGRASAQLGVCPAATCTTCAGANDGAYGGRLCWAVAGTFCGGEVQGSFASKSASCAVCKVFKRVRDEEGRAFRLMPVQAGSHGIVEQFVSFVSILDAINGVVYVADLDTHELLFVNPYGMQLFGDPPIGTRCYEALQTGQTARCSFCTNDQLVVDGQPAAPVVWEFQNTVTGRWFMCIDKAIRWWDGRLVRMEVAIDVTERKLAEEDIRHLAAELTEANRLKDIFTDVLRHDILNPVNAITLSTSMLLEVETDARKTVLLERVQRSAADIVEMTVDATKLASATTGQALELFTMDPAEVLRAVLPDLEHKLAAKEITLADHARGGFSVSFNPMMRNVFDNLLSNAIKYSPGGTRIDVDIEDRGESWLLSVKDQGEGVPDQHKQRIFNRFERLEKEGVKGSGFGLTIAKQIVSMHGGEIWVEDNPAGGSVFFVKLPK